MAGALSALAIGGPRAGWILVSEASKWLVVPEVADPPTYLSRGRQSRPADTRKQFAYAYAEAEATGIGFPCWVPAEVIADPKPNAVRAFVIDELLRAYRAHVEEAGL